MNVLFPMQAGNTSPSRYGMDAAATPTRQSSFFSCLYNAAYRSRMGSLFIIGLLVTTCSGCTSWERVTESTPREVFGFPFKDETGRQYYESGLAIQKLFHRETFNLLLEDLPITQAKPSSGDAKPLLDASCFSPNDPNNPISIEPGSNTVTVHANFRSPFAYPVNGVSQSEGMSKWISKCHCRTPEEELSGKCFSDLLVNSIDSTLAETFKFPDGQVNTLTHEAHQRIAREAGMPFGAFDILVQRERGLTKHGNASHYFGQVVNPGEFLCFDSSTYNPTWHDNLTEIVATSEPGEPACLPWDTLLRARYRDGFADSLSTGLDPLSRWTNAWKEKTVVTVGGTSRDGDRVINTPDAITRPLEGPFRHVLVFAKNEEFAIPFGPERDFDVRNSGKGPGVEGPTRGAFILLIRDAHLMDYLRKRFQQQNTCEVKPGKNVLFNKEPHQYLDCLAHEWGKSVGINIPENDMNWMLDVIVPSNVRPYVAFEVTVDDHPVRVRAGSTLLNIMDRRLSLSAQIFDLRSGNTTTSETPAAQENTLIRNASGRVNYERRAGFATIPVGLCHAVRLEDLLIPLKPGDRVTWHD